MEKSHNLPRDVFLYLLSVITLGVSAGFLAALVFQYVNFSFPDKLEYYSRSGTFSVIRNSMATLIVVFPVYIWTVWFLGRDISRNPEKRDLKIRKWLLYLTLFVAALFIIGDLVTLLRYFLEGEVTTRFTLKVLAVLVIAGAIFTHYFSELKGDKGFSWRGLLDKAMIVLVAGAIVAGFFVAGSPQSQRLVRFDERRVSDLMTIQGQMINYWQKKQALPAKLEQLNDDISGFRVPTDPDNGSAYEYKILGPRKFELCATFSASNVDYSENRDLNYSQPYYMDSPASWLHKDGRVCFERQIDPQLYPPITGDNVKPRPF